MVVAAGNEQPVWLDYILVRPGALTAAAVEPINTDTRKGISTGGIVGAVIGSIVGLGLIIAAFIFWWRKGRNPAEEQQDTFDPKRKFSSSNRHRPLNADFVFCRNVST